MLIELFAAVLDMHGACTFRVQMGGVHQSPCIYRLWNRTIPDRCPYWPIWATNLHFSYCGSFEMQINMCTLSVHADHKDEGITLLWNVGNTANLFI
jgi:hypothetical protein